MAQKLHSPSVAPGTPMRFAKVQCFLSRWIAKMSPSGDGRTRRPSSSLPAFSHGVQRGDQASSTSSASAVRVVVRHDRSEIAIGLLLLDPSQEWLEQRRLPQSRDRRVVLRQVGVAEDGVDLLVTWPAQWRPVLGLAALLFRFEVMKRQQVRRDLPAAQFACLPVHVGHGMHRRLTNRKRHRWRTEPPARIVTSAHRTHRALCHRCPSVRIEPIGPHCSSR